MDHPTTPASNNNFTSYRLPPRRHLRPRSCLSPSSVVSKPPNRRRRCRCCCRRHPLLPTRPSAIFSIAAVLVVSVGATAASFSAAFCTIPPGGGSAAAIGQQRCAWSLSTPQVGRQQKAVAVLLTAAAACLEDLASARPVPVGSSSARRQSRGFMGGGGPFSSSVNAFTSSGTRGVEGWGRGGSGSALGGDRRFCCCSYRSSMVMAATTSEALLPLSSLSTFSPSSSSSQRARKGSKSTNRSASRNNARTRRTRDAVDQPQPSSSSSPVRVSLSSPGSGSNSGNTAGSNIVAEMSTPVTTRSSSGNGVERSGRGGRGKGRHKVGILKTPGGGEEKKDTESARKDKRRFVVLNAQRVPESKMACSDRPFFRELKKSANKNRNNTCLNREEEVKLGTKVQRYRRVMEVRYGFMYYY